MDSEVFAFSLPRNQEILSYKNGPLQYDKVKNPVFWITAEFVQIVYAKVKSVKESQDFMKIKYGEDVLSECDSIIEDIKDMILELTDTGLFTTVGYTPMTLVYREKTPKISVEVQGDLGLCESFEDDIKSSFERIKEYVKSYGYVTGFGTWERDNQMRPGTNDLTTFRVYQMLIQK